MAKDGRMVLLGLMSGAFTEKPLDMRPILLKRLRIEGTTLRSRTLEYQSNLLKSFSEKALDKVRVFFAQVFSTHQADSVSYTALYSR